LPYQTGSRLLSGLSFPFFTPFAGPLPLPFPFENPPPLPLPFAPGDDDEDEKDEEPLLPFW
jgi:hypothetical protein